MLTNKWFKRTTTILVLAMAMIATTTLSAAAAGPDARIIVVHITDGSGVTPADQEPDGLSTEQVNLNLNHVEESNMFIEVDQHGVSAYGFGTNDDGTPFGWGAGPDGVHDEQREFGDTAAGLLAAGRNCEGHWNCHVILVNYKNQTDTKHRAAAKAAAGQLAVNGHKLHAVAVGNGNAAHLGFNWYLSGQAFNAPADEANELVNRVARYVFITDIWFGEGGLNRDWQELSSVEKIWLNPRGCDLTTQWLWASDASCHDKW